jgi:hypothetical protein
MEMQRRCNGVPLRTSDSCAHQGSSVLIRTSDSCAHQVRRCEPACVPSTPDTYVASRLERLDRTPGRCVHASAHHGALISPHRYVGSRLERLDRTPGRCVHASAHHGALISPHRYVGSRLEPFDRTPGRCVHASAHHGALISPHRYVGSRSLEPTPRALGAACMQVLITAPAPPHTGTLAPVRSSRRHALWARVLVSASSYRRP